MEGNSKIGKIVDKLKMEDYENEMSKFLGDIERMYEETESEMERMIKFRNYLEDNNPETFFDGKTFVPKRPGDDIMKFFIFKTLRGNDNMYWYHDGVYKEGGREKIREVCVRVLDDKFRLSHVNDIIAYIQASTYTDPKDINNNWINLKNGMLNPITGEFRTHTPNIFSIIRIPIEYDPEAECPLFKENLENKVNKDVYDTTQEMFGYCFLPGQKYEKAFLFYGPRNTMKSTTLFCLEELVGRENLSATELQRLTDDKFSFAYLYGKTANICADIDSRALNNTGAFMKTTGQDPITTAKKGQHEFTFKPSVKMIFSANVIPPTTRNKTLSFYKRWVLLPYKKRTPKEEIDRNMRKKLLKELPGILNWALEGLKRLLKEEKFTIDLTDEEIKDIYERHSDSIVSFIQNFIDCENDEGVLTKREVYKRYVQYCKGGGLPLENVIKFGRMFKAHTGCGTCKKGVIPAYSGVNFNDKEKTVQETLEGESK